MTDINSVPGLTLADRVSYVGGALLSPMEAKAERNGTANPPATVYTPIYLDKDAEAEASSTNSGGTTDDNSGNTETAEPVVPVTPPVIPDENMSHMPTDEAENQEGQTEDTADNKKGKE